MPGQSLLRKSAATLTVALLNLFPGAFSAPAAMNNYSPVIYCGNGDFEVDGMSYVTQIDRAGNTAIETTYQLVLRNQQIIHYFESQAAIAPFEVNSKGEFILEVINLGYSRVSMPPSMTGPGVTYYWNSNSNSPSGDSEITVAIKGGTAYLTSDLLFHGNLANFYFPNCRQ